MAYLEHITQCFTRQHWPNLSKTCSYWAGVQSDVFQSEPCKYNIYCVTIIGIIVIFKPATLVIIIKPGSRVEGRGGVQAPGATMRIL